MTQQQQNSSTVVVSRHADIAEAFEVFAHGLAGFIDAEMQIYLGEEGWAEIASEKLGRPAEHGPTDPYFQLLVLNRFWGPVFSQHYGEDLRPSINELIEIRNRWAHFSLPEELETLDRSVIIMERLLAPSDPDAAVSIRSIRYRLKHPRTKQAAAPTELELLELQSELDEVKDFFENLQERNTNLSDLLTQSKKITATKQARMAELENQLSLIKNKSMALESHLANERARQHRIEWLLVGFIAAFVLFILIGFQ